MKLHVTKGDTVQRDARRRQGQGGQGASACIPKTGRVVVEGVNIVKKHRKARTAEEQGGIIECAAPIHCIERDAARSEDRCADADRAAASTTDGTKERVSVKSGEAIPRRAKR